MSGTFDLDKDVLHTQHSTGSLSTSLADTLLLCCCQCSSSIVKMVMAVGSAVSRHICLLLHLFTTYIYCTHHCDCTYCMFLVAGLGRAAKWKSRIQQNAAALFSRRSADMQSFVYGTFATDTTRGKGVGQQVKTADEHRRCPECTHRCI